MRTGIFCGGGIVGHTIPGIAPGLAATERPLGQAPVIDPVPPPRLYRRHFEAMCEADGDLDDLSRVFQGNEGAELLDHGFFNDLMSPDDPPARHGHPGHVPPLPGPRRQHGAEAAAARSVLASLGEDDGHAPTHGVGGHFQVSVPFWEWGRRERGGRENLACVCQR